MSPSVVASHNVARMLQVSTRRDETESRNQCVISDPTCALTPDGLLNPPIMMPLGRPRSAPNLEHSQGTREEPERSHILTIANLPDELLLEIFDAYRRHFRDYDHQYRFQWLLWNKKLAWLILIHVCRRWRRVVFASSSRLDLCLVLTPEHKGHMKTIMSPRLPPLPIVIDYCFYTSPTPKDQSRIISALKRCDRVRGITLTGNLNKFDFAKFFKATKCSLPILESLDFGYEHVGTLVLPATFLTSKGSAPHLRCLKMDSVALASILRLLSFSTALVYLSLRIDTAFGPSPQESLPVYLRALPRLRRLELEISCSSISGPAHLTNPEAVVLLTELTCFRYIGPSMALDALVAQFAAPSLQDLQVWITNKITFPNSHLHRFIGDVENAFFSAQLAFDEKEVSLLMGSEPIDHSEPAFGLYTKRHFPDSMMRMSEALSTKLAPVKELLIVFGIRGDTSSQDAILWRRFLQQFRSVKLIQLDRQGIPDIADALQAKDGEAFQDFLPALEAIELVGCKWGFRLIPERLAADLARFQPFVSAREQAGRPIKVGVAVYRSAASGDPGTSKCSLALV